LPALENISLEHERDLTNSANERIIIPETIILTHFMIKRLTNILDGLEIFEDNISRNLEMTSSISMEKIMIDLITNEGMGRQEAYKKAKNLAQKADPKEYLGISQKIVEKVVNSLQTLE
jgi:adenylosuccinate lyase